MQKVFWCQTLKYCNQLVSNRLIMQHNQPDPTVTAQVTRWEATCLQTITAWCELTANACRQTGLQMTADSFNPSQSAATSMTHLCVFDGGRDSWVLNVCVVAILKKIIIRLSSTFIIIQLNHQPAATTWIFIDKLLFEIWGKREFFWEHRWQQICDCQFTS